MSAVVSATIATAITLTCGPCRHGTVHVVLRMDSCLARVKREECIFRIVLRTDRDMHSLHWRPLSVNSTRINIPEN